VKSSLAPFRPDEHFVFPVGFPFFFSSFFMRDFLPSRGVSLAAERPVLVDFLFPLCCLLLGPRRELLG